MIKKSNLMLSLSSILWPILAIAQAETLSTEVELIFQEGDGYSFSTEEQVQITEIVIDSAEKVRLLLPELPSLIKVTVLPLQRDLTGVGGATGRTDTKTEVVIFLSTLYEGGISAAANIGLRATIYHEFHHIVRGWTIQGNKFGPGIPIAAVNEGLANVFSETYTNTSFEGNSYPDDVDQWFLEIKELPTDANYNQWMNEHPDGRIAIGYRLGSYIIHQAMEFSGMSILELSQLPPEDILALVENN